MHCVRRIIYWYWNSLILFSIILFYLNQGKNIYHLQHKRLTPNKHTIIPTTMKKMGIHSNAKYSVKTIKKKNNVKRDKKKHLEKTKTIEYMSSKWNSCINSDMNTIGQPISPIVYENCPPPPMKWFLGTRMCKQVYKHQYKTSLSNIFF